METPTKQIEAVHLDGGNYFDDMRIDISESHRRLEALNGKPRSVRRSRLHNTASLYATGLGMKLGLHELLVVNGVRRRWLNDFRGYWSSILNGRPLWNTGEFFSLLYDYRKRQQRTEQLEWSDSEQHVANYQHPSQIYSTLHQIRKLAISPIVTLALFKQFKKGGRILEYGCSLAPYYNCYRQFFTHLDCKWTLADIPNYPFHYARYLYRNDAGLDMVTINADDFSNPLGERRDFDVVILTTVFEHLDNPLFVADYLLERLKPGGLFVFDYIKSDSKGLDHPEALAMREQCVRNILERTQLIHGRIDDVSKSINLCIAKKRA